MKLLMRQLLLLTDLPHLLLPMLQLLIARLPFIIPTAPITSSARNRPPSLSECLCRLIGKA